MVGEKNVIFALGEVGPQIWLDILGSGWQDED